MIQIVFEALCVLVLIGAMLIVLVGVIGILNIEICQITGIDFIKRFANGLSNIHDEPR